MRQDLNRGNVHWTFPPSAPRMFVTAEVAGSRSIESIKKGPRLRHGPFLIDATGFEPATSASRIEHCFLYTKDRDPESA